MKITMLIFGLLTSFLAGLTEDPVYLIPTGLAIAGSVFMTIGEIKDHAK